jgi:hypothetical protein
MHQEKHTKLVSWCSVDADDQETEVRKFQDWPTKRKRPDESKWKIRAGQECCVARNGPGDALERRAVESQPGRDGGEERVVVAEVKWPQKRMMMLMIGTREGRGSQQLADADHGHLRCTIDRLGCGKAQADGR